MGIYIFQFVAKFIDGLWHSVFVTPYATFIDGYATTAAFVAYLLGR